MKSRKRVNKCFGCCGVCILKILLCPIWLLSRIVNCLLSFKCFVICTNILTMLFAAIILISIIVPSNLSTYIGVLKDSRMMHFDSIHTEILDEFVKAETMVKTISAIYRQDFDTYLWSNDNRLALIDVIEASTVKFPTLMGNVGMVGTEFMVNYLFRKSGRTYFWAGSVTNGSYWVNSTAVVQDTSGKWKFDFSDSQNSQFYYPKEAFNGFEYERNRNGYWLDIYYEEFRGSMGTSFLHSCFKTDPNNHTKEVYVGSISTDMGLSAISDMMKVKKQHEDQIHIMISLKDDHVIASSSHETKEFYHPISEEHPVEEIASLISSVASNIESTSSCDGEESESKKNKCLLGHVSPNEDHVIGNGMFSSEFIYYRRNIRNGMDLLFVSKFPRSQFYSSFDTSIYISVVALVLFLCFTVLGSWTIHTIIFYPLTRVMKSLRMMSQMKLEKVRRCSTFSEIRSIQNAVNLCHKNLAEYRAFLPTEIMEDEFTNSVPRRKSVCISQSSILPSIHHVDHCSRRNSGSDESSSDVLSEGSSNSSVSSASVHSNGSSLETASSKSHSPSSGENSSFGSNNSGVDNDSRSVSSGGSSCSYNGECEVNPPKESYHTTLGKLGKKHEKGTGTLQKRLGRFLSCCEGVLFILVFKNIYQILESTAIGKADFIDIYELFFQYVERTKNHKLRRRTKCIKADSEGLVLLFDSPVNACFYAEDLRRFLLRTAPSVKFLIMIHQSCEIFRGIIGSKSLRKTFMFEKNLEILKTHCNQYFMDEISGESKFDQRGSVFITEIAAREILKHRTLMPLGLFQGFKNKKSKILVSVILYRVLISKGSNNVCNNNSEEWMYELEKKNMKEAVENLAIAYVWVREKKYAKAKKYCETSLKFHDLKETRHLVKTIDSIEHVSAVEEIGEGEEEEEGEEEILKEFSSIIE